MRVKTHVIPIQKEEIRHFFAARRIQRSEKKMKVVLQKHDKNKPIMLR